MEVNELEKPYSRWEWLLYIILLPSLFTLILVGIILTFMKVDVITPILEVGNKIPYIEKVLPDPKGKVDDDFFLYENTFIHQSSSKSGVANESTTLDNIAYYEEEIIKKNMVIAQLEMDLKLADEQIAEMEEEMSKLTAADQEANLAEQKAKSKEIAQLYGAMTASKAAPILSQLENKEAAQILTEMDNKKRAQILAKMNPQKAAELTLLLKEPDAK